MSGDGKVTTDFSGHSGWGSGGTVQADGKILAAGSSNGDFALVRYNSNGTLDTTFGGDGKVTTDIGGSNDVGGGVTVQADGKILVAGTAYSADGLHSDFALVRYNSNGTLDATFGGDGKVTADIGPVDFGGSVTVQADGKILVAGTAYSADGLHSDFALVRYNSNGTLDTSFGGDGKVTADIGPVDFGGSDVVVQADGKILMAGSSYSADGLHSDFVLVRYNSNGTLDTTFDGDGKGITDFGNYDTGGGLGVQADGKILVSGSSGDVGTANYDFALARYNPNWTLDTTFGGDGKVTTDLSSGYDGGGASILADGKILMAGTSGGDFALARYNSNGSLDTTFGGDGKVTTDFDGWIDGGGAIILTNGKILMVGSSGSPDGLRSNFALARYNTNGSLDTSFGGASNTSSGTPTAGNDKLNGTTGNDTLDGGAGNDKMTGGKGDDTYHVDSVKDTVTEKANEGFDTVISHINYTLGKEVEALVLMSGMGNLSGTGNKSNNTLTGNEGANILNSKEGNDTLVGGAGADKFLFDTKLSATTNVDTISDFVSGTDAINLSKKLFGKYTAGANLAADFVSEASAVAHDASDHFLYDTSTGNLYYDVDGNGAKAAVQFATLTGHPTMAASDLQIV